MRYLVIQRNRKHLFDTLDEAKAYCQRVFERTGVIVAITAHK